MLWGDIMDCKEMGSRIKKARLSQKITQEQLAELLDISVSYVSLIERGSRNATVETLLAIADVLHVSVTSLLQDSGDLDRDEEQNNIWNELTKNRTGGRKRHDFTDSQNHCYFFRPSKKIRTPRNVFTFLFFAELLARKANSFIVFSALLP